MTVSYRQQAEMVEVTAMEWRNSVAQLEGLPIGKGGVDAALLKLKHMRVEALFEAARTLHRVADKVEAQAKEGAAA